jgi:hypothetical protein
MKKLLLLLGIFSILIAFVSAPRVIASDRDVGYQFELPADQNAVVTADCQAADLRFECITVIATRDPGSLCTELRAHSSGLEVKSPAISGTLPNGDLTDTKFFRIRQCTRLYVLNNRYNATRTTISTSNGGPGY